MTYFLEYKLLSETATKPTKATELSTGYDLYSSEEVTIHSHQILAVSTGLQMDLRDMKSVDVQIRPRSGMALKHGVTVLNSPGTVDKDYLGEIKVILINHSDMPYEIKVGDRIAQMVFGLAIDNVTFFPTHNIEEDTGRGKGGFGSTGT